MKYPRINYTFDPVLRKIMLSDFVTVLLERFFLITNVTDKIVIYRFSDPEKGGSVSGNVITLDYNTTGMGADDDLQILYDDGATPLTDEELRATPVPVSGSVSVSNFPATQPVSGPLTDAQLRAADVKVSLDGESVSVSNFPATQPISAASLPLPTGAATETTLANLPDTLANALFMLRNMLGYLEVLGTQDQAQRQRVHVDIVDLITTLSTLTSLTEAVSLRSLNGVDTRYLFFDSANIAYNTGVCANLRWS